MKVFIYDSPNELNIIFGEHDSLIPFLGTNLLNFSTMGIIRNAQQTGEGHTIYLPDSWEVTNTSLYSFYTNVIETLKDRQTKEYELVFLMSVFSLAVGDISKDDIAYLKQHPEKMFQNNGVIGGYLKKGQELPTPEEFTGFDAFWNLDITTYLDISQKLVSQLTVDSIDIPETVTVYGNPSVLSDKISNSTICAPSYISREASVVNSYIAPGTIITGETKISGSKVFGSFIENSTILSSELTDSIVSDSLIEQINLTKAIVPKGSILQYEG